MSKPIFVATHPRACSTAFERVFMTRRDSLQCVHEPFGDAYYFGPERLAERYAHDESARADSGFAKSTYNTIMDRINRENTEGKRIFIKDMAQYFIPPDSKPVSIAPSLLSRKRGIGTDELPAASGVANGLHNGDSNGVSNGFHNGVLGTRFDTTAVVPDADVLDAASDAPYSTFKEKANPTVVPKSLLGQFHFAFLIRHPQRSIPSYYRCCVPPLDSVTGFYDFRPDEAGYVELVQLFDFLRSANVVGPELAHPSGQNGAATNGTANRSTHMPVEICVIDADDLLDKPQETIEAFCKSVGIDFDPDMLNWDTEEEQEHARDAFEKWKGFHDDAINSRDLKPRTTHQRTKSVEACFDDWVAKFGREGADVIQKTIHDNVRHYEYLKQFCIKV